MIAVVDYRTGNLRSVCNALKRLDAEMTVTSDAAEILRASHVIMPGVGEAAYAMEQLRNLGLDRLIPSLSQPVLGICIGMQVMCRSSQEGNVPCLGIFDAEVKSLRQNANDLSLKIPHMGWDTVNHLSSSLMAGIAEDTYFYYVHSFAPEICRDTIAVTDYAMPFSAALCRGNFYGTQFHPEKSGAAGELLLSNFLNL